MTEPEQIQNLRPRSPDKDRQITEDDMVYENLRMKSASQLREKMLDAACLTNERMMRWQIKTFRKTILVVEATLLSRRASEPDFQQSYSNFKDDSNLRV